MLRTLCHVLFCFAKIQLDCTKIYVHKYVMTLRGLFLSIRLNSLRLKASCMYASLMSIRKLSQSTKLVFMIQVMTVSWTCPPVPSYNGPLEFSSCSKIWRSVRFVLMFQVMTVHWRCPQVSMLRLCTRLRHIKIHSTVYSFESAWNDFLHLSHKHKFNIYELLSMNLSSKSLHGLSFNQEFA